jgi:hypothetical protein
MGYLGRVVLGHAPTGHTGRPSCLDGPCNSGYAMPDLVGLDENLGLVPARSRFFHVLCYRTSNQPIKHDPYGQI